MQFDKFPKEYSDWHCLQQRVSATPTDIDKLIKFNIVSHFSSYAIWFERSVRYSPPTVAVAAVIVHAVIDKILQRL